MSGFEAIDRAYVKSSLEEFMPDTATVTRRNTSKTGGDYVKGAATTIATGLKCRVMPITAQGTEKIRPKQWPAAVVDRAEYIITLASGGAQLKDGDTATVSGVDYTLISIRYDNASWHNSIRAMAVRVE